MGINGSEQKEHCRLACQVKVKQDLEIEVEPEVFSVQKWKAQIVLWATPFGTGRDRPPVGRLLARVVRHVSSTGLRSL